MPGRGPQTFKKRQKEQQRKEKQQEKMAKRLARKHESASPTSSEDEEEGTSMDSGVGDGDESTAEAQSDRHGVLLDT